MENKKESAIEYLIDNIYLLNSTSWKNIVEQAKAMEKEQIIEFADEYADAVMGGCIKRAEQYYNETYKQQDND